MTENESRFPAPGEWETLRKMCEDMERGERPALTADLVAYVHRVARQTGLEDAQTHDSEGLYVLAKRARERIRVGSRRLMIALNGAFDAMDSGDRDTAERLLRAVLEVEAVPWLREQARHQLVQFGFDPD